MNRFYILLAVLLFTSCGLLKPTTTPLDRDSDQLVAAGKRLMQNRKYEDALDKFEIVREKSFNRSTTAAIYLSGLAAYYLEFNEIALQRFATIIKEYDKSRYVEDAKYHQALIWTKNRRSEFRIKGVENLMTLSNLGKTSKIKSEAKNEVLRVLFEVLPIADLELMYENPPNSYRQQIFEALAYRKMDNGEINGARLLYQQYIETEGKDSEFLKKMFPEETMAPVPELFEPNIMRIAMFLPLHLNDSRITFNNEIPNKSIRALEFYEGFQLAVDLYTPKAKKQIFVKVFDTRQDTNVTKSYFDKLDEIRPNLIVGGVYNTTSQVISNWAEENKTIQIIPISATAELVENKNYVFLAHPSAYTHGQKMAEYAFNDLGLKYAAVFTDKNNATQRLADGFFQTFTDLGGRVDTLEIDDDYEEIAIEQIPKLVSRIPASSDSAKTCVYIPLMGNEESASLIVNVLKKEAKKVVIMGSPHFRSRYNTLDRDTKEGFGLLFSTSHYNNIEAEEYESMYNEYLKKYKYPPSDNVIQGFDLAMYILKMYDQYNPSLGMTLDRYLRVYPKSRGIHLDYRFNGLQSNQQVNIGKYTPEGVIRVETKN